MKTKILSSQVSSSPAKFARIAELETEIQNPLETGHSAEPQAPTGFQKLLLAESAESTRLKAKLSGVWNQDIQLPGLSPNPGANEPMAPANTQSH